jgi:hypothetical protein
MSTVKLTIRRGGTERCGLDFALPSGTSYAFEVQHEVADAVEDYLTKTMGRNGALTEEDFFYALGFLKSGDSKLISKTEPAK